MPPDVARRDRQLSARRGRRSPRRPKRSRASLEPLHLSPCPRRSGRPLAPPPAITARRAGRVRRTLWAWPLRSGNALRRGPSHLHPSRRSARMQAARSRRCPEREVLRPPRSTTTTRPTRSRLARARRRRRRSPACAQDLPPSSHDRRGDRQQNLLGWNSAWSSTRPPRPRPGRSVSVGARLQPRA